MMKVEIGTTTYSVKITGKGSPVVLLHGFTGSKVTWESTAKSLQDNFQIITIDLPGHGKTITSNPRTMASFAVDLAEIFRYLKLTSVHLIGYSMGGRTALSFAMQYPEWIKSLTLESASPGLKSPEEREIRIDNDEKLASKIEQEGLDSFVQFWENLPLFHTQKSLPTTIQKSIRKERLTQSPQGLAQSLRFMGTGKQRSWWDELEKIDFPTLLVVGEKDEKFVLINRQMQSRINGAQLAVIDNVGHAAHIENPEKFNTAVLNFILQTNRIK